MVAVQPGHPSGWSFVPGRKEEAVHSARWEEVL